MEANKDIQADDAFLKEASRIVLYSKIKETTAALDKIQRKIDDLFMDIGQSQTGFGTTEQQHEFDELDQEQKRIEKHLETLSEEYSILEQWETNDEMNLTENNEMNAEEKDRFDEIEVARKAQVDLEHDREQDDELEIEQ